MALFPPILFAVVLASSGISATAQNAADPALQVRAASLVAAINGTPVDRREWIERHVSKADQEKVGATIGTVAEASGGLTVRKTGFTSPISKIYARAGKGGSSRIDLLPSRTEPGKVGALFAFPWPEPFEGRLDRKLDEAALVRAIDERVRFSVERNDFSGTVLVVRKGKPIYSASFGLADQDHGIANTATTLFNIGSMDKMFTAVAIGQLIEVGKLTLDSRLVDILPDYPNRDAANKITVRHLLSHTSGLGDFFGRPAYDRTKPHDTVSALLQVFAAEPLEFEPGSKANYSNEGFLVLGAVVEKLSGRSYYDYVAAKVFKPAVMTRTGYPTLAEVAPGRAVGYRFEADDPLGTRPRGPNWLNLGYKGLSMGGGYSTAADLVAFLTSLRTGKLLSPELTEAFTKLNQGGEDEYGLGFMHSVHGNLTLRGHLGGGPGVGINSEAMTIWETGDTYAVVSNYDAPFAQILGADLAAILLAQRQN